MGGEYIMAVKEDQRRDAKSSVHQIMGVSSLLSIWLTLTQVSLASVAQSCP